MEAEHAAQVAGARRNGREPSAFLSGLLLGAALGGAGASLLGAGGGPESARELREADRRRSPMPEEAAPSTVRISAEAAASGRIHAVLPRRGSLAAGLVLNGRVTFDETKLARVVSSVGGVIRDLPALLGARVHQGDVLAVIQSQELGRAKGTYLERRQAFQMARAEHDRRVAVHEATERMVDLLSSAVPAAEAREQIDSLDVGEGKGTLLVAHANVVAARAALAREKGLAEKGISSQQQYEEARRTSEAAEAEYRAAVEEFRLTSDLALQEGSNEVAAAETELAVAERTLEILGLGAAQIERVATGATLQLAQYELRSPLFGRVIARRATVGEKVTADSELFTLADLTSVWVIGAATPDQAVAIREGAVAEIVAESLPERVFTGTVWSLGAVIEERTRTMPVRVHLSNEQELLRPGMYVRIALRTAQASEEEHTPGLILPGSAIQTVNGQTSVFVRAASDIYRLTSVEIGKRWGAEVEVLAGLEPEDEVVDEGSFLLKAELGKGSMEEQDD